MKEEKSSQFYKVKPFIGICRPLILSDRLTKNSSLLVKGQRKKTKTNGKSRTETNGTAEELPADKRACSSLEFRRSSTNSSSIQTHLNSPNSTPDADMDTSTVLNICKQLPSEGHAPSIEAIPKLCDLLQHEDQQLVESMATCLIKISEHVCQSSEMLEELCKHELVNQVMHLMKLNSRITISQPIYNGSIGLLVKLSSGSFVAFRSLYELNISSTLKGVLSTYDLSYGVSSQHLVDGNCNQVHEVLKLLNELLPTSAGDQDNQVLLDKESFLADHPDLLQKFETDILHTLVQVANSGANIYVCYGCLSVISKLVFLSKSDMLVELLKTANIPSFLTGMFTQKNQHLLM